MAQIFSEQFVLFLKVGALVIVFATLLGIGIARWQTDYANAMGEPVAQPIPFSHKHHVGDDGIDCRYCHTGVEKEAVAGIPSSEICMTCHSQLFTDAPLLAPLRQSARTHRPLAWTRVYDLPDFVYFDHSIHINKGVACIECHGHIDRMPLTARVAPITMQWCIDCHRNPAPHLHAQADIFAMDRATEHHPVPLYHLVSERRRTDCSTCHR
jgi:hypothetical protein